MNSVYIDDSSSSNMYLFSDDVIKTFNALIIDIFQEDEEIYVVEKDIFSVETYFEITDYLYKNIEKYKLDELIELFFVLSSDIFNKNKYFKIEKINGKDKNIFIDIEDEN